MIRTFVLTTSLAVLVVRPAVTAGAEPTLVRVGSKSFTEGILLGEIATHMIRATGLDVVHERALGDSSTFQALVRGDIDVYAEYTGTLRQSIFADQQLKSDAQLREVLSEMRLRMTGSIGFENSFALGTTRQLAERLTLKSIGDLPQHPDLRFGFTESFLNRGDGWPGLQAHYQLPQTDVRGMDHDLAYVAIQSGDLDVMDLYTTDAEIVAYDLVALVDDRRYFPQYKAVYLYRSELEQRAPTAVSALRRLEDSITAAEMRRLNAEAKIDRRSDAEVAADFLNRQFQLEIEVQPTTIWKELVSRTREHLFMVTVAMTLGSLVAIPLGVVSYKRPTVGRMVMWMISILQTIPALALLALMVPLLGIKYPPAIAALFCYSMLPIVRNTYTGLMGIAPATRESAIALGLTSWTRLWRIELPLSAPMILAGLKTATVLSIGFATLGAFVGAGGYGEPILTGVRLQDTSEILRGAVPAALMAISAELMFEGAERYFIPRGLRLKRP